MIKKNPQITTADMANELDVRVVIVKRIIEKMSNASYIGNDYSGRWEMK